MSLIYVIVIVTVVLVAAVAWHLCRKQRPYNSQTLELRGAISAIIDGTAHPGMQRLLVPIPGLQMKKPQVDATDHDSKQAGADPVTRISATANTGAVARHGAEDPTVPKGRAKTTPSQNVPANIFREYDIRGLVDKELTPALMQRIGMAIGTMVVRQRRNKIVVGSDNRLSGENLIKGLIKGLGSTGLQITNIGIVPTPVLYYSVVKYSIPDGVMLTGSHNDYEYNGCKIVIGGTPLNSSGIKSLYESISRSDFTRARGKLVGANPFANYIEQMLEKFANVKAELHIAVDCAHGVTGAYIPFVLRKLGCKVTEIACGLDQSNARHAPDPTMTEHLEELRTMIKEAKGAIDLGIAYDGDGDRLVVIDSSGNIIWPDILLMLFASRVLKATPGGTVVYDVKCSSALGPWIESLGGKPLMWKTGHSLIRNKMNEAGAVLAGELSGHIFWKEWYGFDDAIYSSCRLVQIITDSGNKLEELIARLPGGCGSPEYRITMQNDGQAHDLVAKIRAKYSDHKARLVDIDGLRFEYPDRWGLVRPSNTGPVLVCRFEGDDEAKLSAIKQEIHTMLSSVDADLDIPF